MKKTIGFEISVKVGIKDFDKLSDKRKSEVLKCFQNELVRMINNTSEMTFLGGAAEYIKGIETENGCFIKVI